MVNMVVGGVSFGGQTLANYDEGTWTPTFSFGTPGDLSVTYATQFGSYTRIGRLVYVLCTLTCTPTFTTSSGNILIDGLPFTVISTNQFPAMIMNTNTNLVLDAGYTMISVNFNSNATNATLVESGSAKNAAGLSATNITSGNSTVINFGGLYFI